MEVVGVIGLGRMGSKLAENLLKKYETVVWNRTVSKTAELSAKGAIAASSPAELARKSTVIISMLATPEATTDVILGRGPYRGVGVLDGLSPGKVVVDMSTNSPIVVRRMAVELSSRNVDLLDAPVMGSVQAAAEASLTILASGNPSTFEKVRPILESMGRRVWYLGDVGRASSLKIIFNLHLWLMTAAFAEAFTLAKRAGLDPSLTLEIWNSSNQKTYISETKGPKILKNDWKAAFTVDLALKDLHILSELAEELAFPLFLGGVVRELYKSCASMGLGDFDFAAIAQFYDKLSGEAH
ncbi:MAG: NAD(P)-dependent oxidoreductase [Candidatus Caldarchaeum sp.]